MLMLFIQETVSFRIKYEPDVKGEENSNPKSTIDDTQAVQKDSESDKVKGSESHSKNELEKSDPKVSSENADVKQTQTDNLKGIVRNPAMRRLVENLENPPESTEQKTSSENGDTKQSQTDHLKGIVRNPAMRRLVENEDSQLNEKSGDPETQSPDVYSESENSKDQSKVPEPKINSENKHSMKQSPADVFKGFGRNPAFRKLIENDDSLVYVKESQPEVTATKTESNLPKSEISQKNDGDNESGKTKSNIQIENKIAQPEAAKPEIVNLVSEKSPVLASPNVAAKPTEIKNENKMNALPPLPDETTNSLSTADLTEITQSMGKGEAQSVECDLPNLDVYSRCFANVMEVTVTSRSALLGRISFQEAEGHIDISGNTVIFYAVYGRQTESGFMWRLQNGVTEYDVDVDCNSCHTLDLRMIVLVMEELQEKNKRCVVDLTCIQPNMTDQSTIEISRGSQNESPPSTSRVHSAKTTLNILKGTSIDSEVLTQDHMPIELGTKMGLSISAYTKEISLDLHVLMCEARGEDGLTSTLTKDGCSVHHLVDEFREVLGMVHDPEIDDHHMVRVTQHTTFEVFNFSPKPQTMAIICKIKMCGGECDERPGCVKSEVNLGHRKQKSFTVFYEEVVLGQMLNVAGLPELAGGPQNSGFLSNIIEPEEENFRSDKDGVKDTLDLHANCIPRSMFYLSLFLLGGLFLLLLVLALYFSKTIVLPRMTSYKLQSDEVESPSRALYQEYSSPRRRSPGSKSPNQQSTMLDRIVYS